MPDEKAKQGSGAKTQDKEAGHIRHVSMKK